MQVQPLRLNTLCTSRRRPSADSTSFSHWVCLEPADVDDRFSFDEKDELISHISRQSIDVLSESTAYRNIQLG